MALVSWRFSKVYFWYASWIRTKLSSLLKQQPQLGELGDPVSATPMSNSVSNRSSEHPGGESVASGVGSMGSTDHANEEDFTQGLSDRKTQAFVGQASEIRWMQRLERELTKSPTQDIDRNAMDHTDQPVSSRDTGPPGVGNSSRYPSNNPNPYPDDMDTSMIGDQLDPYDVPVKPTADALIASYFRTVHPSFPILDKAYFLDQYEDYFKTQNSESFRDRTFITTLQLVFAIGAVHAHLIEADWVGDERDHLLYFAKARILGIDTGILNDMAYLGQVQVFGLGGMYLMVTDQINRYAHSRWGLLYQLIRMTEPGISLVLPSGARSLLECIYRILPLASRISKKSIVRESGIRFYHWRGILQS